MTGPRLPWRLNDNGEEEMVRNSHLTDGELADRLDDIVRVLRDRQEAYDNWGHGQWNRISANGTETAVPLQDFSVGDRLYRRSPNGNCWTVKSPNGTYFVLVGVEPWSCSCPSGQFRGRCRHVDELKNRLTGDSIR
jgi:hypothetical protein